MNYVTYDETGRLTGAYQQDLHPDHTSNHIEVPEEIRRNWVIYRANAERTGVEIAPPPAFDLMGAKAAKLQTANSECERRMSLLVTGYPEREQQTFPKQESEARAFSASATAATPMIDALATNRGIAKSELVTRIIAKADLFAQYSGAVIGYRQKLEDLITAATTQATLDAINPSAGWPV